MAEAAEAVVRVIQANRSLFLGGGVHRREIIAGAVVGLVLTLIEIAEVPIWTVPDLIYAVIQCGLIIITPLFPRISAAGIIVTYVVTVIVPHEFEISGFYGVWLALIVVGYFLPVSISSILFLITPTALAASILIHPVSGFTAEGGVGLSLFFFGFYFLGLMLRRHEIKQKLQSEAARTLQIEQENSRLKRDNALAIELHDSLAGGLSSIALRSGMRESHDEDFEEIHSDSLILLDKVHQILDVLTQPRDENSAAQQPESLSRTASALDNSLQSRGFCGSIKVTVSDEELNSEVASFVDDLLGEMVRNIERHASPSLGEYAISIRSEGRTLQILATNPVPVESQIKSYSHELYAGKGLMLYSHRAQSLKGSLTYGAIEGSWFLQATMPL